MKFNRFKKFLVSLLLLFILGALYSCNRGPDKHKSNSINNSQKSNIEDPSFKMLGKKRKRSINDDESNDAIDDEFSEENSPLKNTFAEAIKNPKIPKYTTEYYNEMKINEDIENQNIHLYEGYEGWSGRLDKKKSYDFSNPKMSLAPNLFEFSPLEKDYKNILYLFRCNDNLSVCEVIYEYAFISGWKKPPNRSGAQQSKEKIIDLPDLI